MASSSASNLKPWALSLQRQRSRRLFAAVRETCRDFFAEDGRCRVSDGQSEGAAAGKTRGSPFYLREIVHSAVAFFEGNAADAEFANRILDHVEIQSCDFTTVSLIEILLRYGTRVSPANRRRIREHLKHEVEHVCKPHNAFIGYNDNFPAMACFILVVGGELVGKPSAVQAGLDSLYSLRDLLTRRGFFSEYNSPTYAAVTLHGLGETARWARHPEARRLAKAGAERMWLDLALHWHPEISFLAGPHSRSYHGNSIAWAGVTTTVLWVVLGDVVRCGPLDTIFGANAAQSHEARANTLPFCQAGCGGYAGTLHPIADDIGALFLKKAYPFRVCGTTEFATFHAGEYRRLENGAPAHIPGRCADFGACEAQLYTYMEKDFALGTATRMFLSGGQCEYFYELHRRVPQPRTWGDIRAVFSRYTVNDLEPEAPGTIDLLPQQGVGFAVQDDRRALVVCQPNAAFVDGIRSLKLSLILQERTGPVDEIWMGARRLKDGDGESATADWVILRDGVVLLAFLPLCATDLGRRMAMRSRRENGCRVISFYNYEGAARDFTHPELKRVQNGFVCEVSTTREFPTVAAFRKALRQAQVSDTTLMEARRVRYLRAGRELALWLDPLQQSVKAAVVNGRQVACPPLAADGLDAGRVPWLGQGVQHRDLAWWERIAKRPALAGLEGVSGKAVP